MRGNRLRDVRQALAQRGFKQVFDVPGYEFVGRLKAAGLSVPVRLVYADREFAALPTIRITDDFVLPRAVVPHVSVGGSVCFLDFRVFSIDRYAAAAQALSFLDRAAMTLEAGLRDAPEDAIAEEFLPTWAGLVARIGFGAYEGFAKTTGKDLRLIQAQDAKEANAYSVVTAQRLSFTAAQKRPETFGEFLDWLRHWDSEAARRLMSGTKHLTSADPFALVAAPNGIVGAWLRVSKRGQVKALERKVAWSRLLEGSVGRAIPVDRIGGERVDMAHVLGRNGQNGVAPLAGKSIVLIGCGSIGGFLSRSLAQFGAGLDGALTLVDPDMLTVANVGRHLLGQDSAGEQKAVACRRRILDDMPGLSVSAVDEPINGRKHLFSSAEVVIDATGEEAVSEMLNEWRLDLFDEGRSAPTLFHTWLEGQGAAARSFMNSARVGACFRCLEPVRGEPRYKVLKTDTPNEMGGTCGDLPFTPYGPSAPMTAAGLTAQLVADWAAGRAKPSFRTVRVDFANTIDCKATSPTKSASCPACG